MKKTYTRISALLLALLLLLTGCGSGTAATETEAAAKETQAETEKETTEAETAAAVETVPETAAETETETETETEETEEETKAEQAETAAEAGGTFEAEVFKGVPSVSRSELLDVHSLELLESCGLFKTHESYGEPYQLVDADLNVIADDGYLYLDDHDGFIDFAKSSDTNGMGLLDREGKVVVPAEYGSVDVLNDRWAVGLYLTETTKEAGYDYWGFGGGYYNLDHADFYYEGAKAGTLDRAGYDYANAYGDYLYLKDRSGTVHFYDREFREAEAKAESAYSEYDYDYSKDTIWHLGSGTEAFTEGCSLTEDEVSESRYNLNGRLLDLQGNAVADTSGYTTVYSFYSGYAMVRDASGKYGIIREDGTVISDCVYDEIDMYEEVVPGGYVSAERDGKFCMISLADGKETATDYAVSAMDKNYAPFASRVSDDGKYTVVTGLAGVLEETFDDVSISIDGKSVIPVMKGEACGVIDLAGNFVVEADGTYDATYDLTISEDSTVILGDTSDGYYIYKLSYDGSGVAAENAPAAAAETEKTEETAKAAEQEEDAFQLGTTDGGKYSNPTIGLACEFKDGWSLATAEQLEQIYGLTKSLLEEGELNELLESGSVVPDLYAYDQSGNSVNITVQKNGIAQAVQSALLSDEELIDQTLKEMESYFETLCSSLQLSDASIEKGTTMFLGKETPCIRVSGKQTTVAGKMDFYETLVFPRTLSYLATVTAAAYGTDTTADILAAFTEAE